MQKLLPNRQRKIRTMGTVVGKTVKIDAHGSLNMAQIHEIDLAVYDGADHGDLYTPEGTYMGEWSVCYEV